MVCAGLTVAALPAVAAESDGTDPAIPGLVNSAELTTPVIASGVLSNDGARSLDGALVVLYAWPASDDLSRIKVGETVKTAPVGYALADADGNFALRISDQKMINRYRGADGKVDFEVDASTADSLYSYHFTANPSAASQKTTLSQKTTSSQGTAAAVELAIQPVPDIAPRVETPQFAPDGGAVDKVCTVSKVSNLGNFWVSVGYGYVSGSGASMKFTYTSGSSSTLGVGVSATGAPGTFSASGASAVSSTSTVSYPSTASFKVWKTQFTWGKYKKVCTTTGAGAITTYLAKADGYAGGSSIQTVAGYPTANYCVSNAAGTSFTKASTAAYNSSVGASTSGTLGVNLSAKTGYSTSAKITFTFTAAKKLCGTSGLPGGTPGRLVAR